MVRGAAYDENEYQSLFELFEQIRPISASEWAELADQHLERFPDRGRDGPALSRKFAALRGKKPPTGSTRPPWYVERARELYNEMKGLCGGSTGSAQDIMEEFDDDEEDKEKEGEGGEFNEELNDGGNVFEDCIGGSEHGGGGERVVAAAVSSQHRSRSSAGVNRSKISAAKKGMGNKLSSFSSDSLKSSPFTRQYTKKPSDGDDDFSMKNMMQMMMLQQQSEREDRLQRMEEMRANEKARMEENRANEKKQQQFMNMFLLSAFGSKVSKSKKRKSKKNKKRKSEKKQKAIRTAEEEEDNNIASKKSSSSSSSSSSSDSDSDSD